MINQTLAQWFETLEDDQRVGFGGTWANAWSPVWEVKNTAPASGVSSENTQSLRLARTGIPAIMGKSDQANGGSEQQNAPCAPIRSSAA